MTIAMREKIERFLIIVPSFLPSANGSGLYTGVLVRRGTHARPWFNKRLSINIVLRFCKRACLGIGYGLHNDIRGLGQAAGATRCGASRASDNAAQASDIVARRVAAGKPRAALSRLDDAPHRLRQAAWPSAFRLRCRPYPIPKQALSEAAKTQGVYTSRQIRLSCRQCVYQFRSGG